MPARTSGVTWRPAAVALPALVLAVAFAASVPVGAAQAAVPAAPTVLTAPVGPIRSPAIAAQADRPARSAAPVTRAAVSVSRAAVWVSRAVLVLREAASLRGRPYQYGAAGPRSFDCSGFTRFVFAAVGRSLPHNAASQYALSHKIAKSAIRPGDLVFFVSYGHVYHVGIYAGHGLIWHAPHSGDNVRLATISTSSWVAGRVL